MKIRCGETHTVLKIKEFDIPESELIEEFGSIDACKKAIEENSEKWQEFENERVWGYDWDVVKEDWITEREGGFETEWKVDE
jgi:hypothetical protein